MTRSRTTFRDLATKEDRGFTLVEMIVSLAIFSIVSVVALGAVVKIISANNKAQTLQASVNNLSFALDTMSRELRTGRAFVCNPSGNIKGEDLDTKSCSSGNSIAFASSRRLPLDSSGYDTCSAAIAYRFVEKSSGIFDLQKAVQKNCDTGINSNDFQSVVDDNVDITGYFIDVRKSGNAFPIATIGIAGYSGAREREKTYFEIQTSVSARVRE